MNGKALANLARKAFPDDVMEERKQVSKRLGDELSDLALSSLYLSYCINHAEGSVTDMTCCHIRQWGL